MSRAEKFIEENTKALKESNGKEYFKWLTPDQARNAVEIAREEIYEWLKEYIYIYSDDLYLEGLIRDLKQAMKTDD